MTVTFAGKQAIVTGAGSGIGAALCRALAAAGADVVCTDVDEAAAARTAAPLGARSARLDVTDAAAVQACVDDVVRPDRAPRPDVQQRGHHVGRRHRTADPGPVERHHRRQHPRRRARRGRRLPADGPPRPRPHHQHRVDGGSGRGGPDHQLRDDQACGSRPVARPALRGRRPWRRRAGGVPDRRRDADPGQGRDRRVRRPRLLPDGSAQRDVLLRRRLANDTLRAIERNRALLVAPRQARMAWRFTRLAPGLLQRMSIRSSPGSVPSRPRTCRDCQLPP